jgi:hypothetical protein
MLSKEERKELIEQYLKGYDEVVGTITGLSDDQLRAHPIPGKWSACEIVQHLADSESTSALRLRRLLAEEKPLIQGYDQEFYATRFRYNERDIAPALEALKAARATTGQILALMSEEDWQRMGEHSESGPYGTEDWLKIYAVHAHNHASQIRALRKAMNV